MKLQVYNNTEFGSVRTTVIDGEPFFIGKDIAEVLGYSNPQKALRDYVDEEDKTLNDSFTVNGTKEILDRYNVPYQSYVDCGWFRVVEQKYMKNGERASQQRHLYTRRA